MSSVTRFLLILILWLPLFALNAWAIQIIWNWYIPLIFQLPNLEFGEAIGLALIVGYLTHQYRIDTNKKTENEEWAGMLTSVFLNILKPLLSVGVAWVYLQLWPITGS